MSERHRPAHLFMEIDGKKYYLEDKVLIHEHLSKLVREPDKLHHDYWIQLQECSGSKGTIIRKGKTELTISCDRCHTSGMILDSRQDN